MRKIHTTAFLLLFALFSSAQYSWVNKNTFTGTARLDAISFNLNGTGYMVGGFTQYPGVWVNEVWAYNPSTDVWTQKNNYPAATAGGACFTIGNGAYSVGGYVGNGNNSDATYLYNPSNDSWNAKANFPVSAVGGPFSFAINGIGYVGAGERQGANNSNTAYSYSPDADSWSPIANYPESVVNTVGFAIDSFGYAGLGGDGSDHLSTGFYKYSPSTNSWASIAAFPGEPRSSAMSFVIDGKAYVGGGWTLAPGTNVTGHPAVIYDLSDFYCYDPSTDTWSAVSGILGRAREHSSTFVLNNSAYLVGGIDDYTGLSVATVNQFGTCQTITEIKGIGGNENNNAGIAIYPNPSTNDVTVKISNIESNKVKYEVVSVDGKLVKTGATNQNTFGFSTSNLSDGVYILTVTDSKGTSGAERFEVIH